MTKTVVALYDDFASAEGAVRDLADGGFRREDISLVANDASGECADRCGLAAGRTEDGIGGLLAGPDRFTLPGVGPVVAAGPIGAAANGAGATDGGLTGALTHAGVPREEADSYAEGVRRGGTLVAARTDDAEVGRAVDILERNDPVDTGARAALWREGGWTGFGAEAAPYAADELARERERIAEQEARIPVVEEDVRIGKREVERGGVRVHSFVTERPVDETVELRDETVHVERRPVDRPATSEEAGDAFQETWVEVKEIDEEAVVSKESRVVEEVVVGKDAETREEHVRDTVRRKDVEVEKIPETGARGATTPPNEKPARES